MLQSGWIIFGVVDVTLLLCVLSLHYNGVIMSTMASQITSLAIVYSTVYSGTDERKHQSSGSLAFVRGVHRWPVNSPHKGPVTRKIFPFDDVIMLRCDPSACDQPRLGETANIPETWCQQHPSNHDESNRYNLINNIIIPTLGIYRTICSCSPVHLDASVIGIIYRISGRSNGHSQ